MCEPSEAISAASRKCLIGTLSYLFLQVASSPFLAKQDDKLAPIGMLIFMTSMYERCRHPPTRDSLPTPLLTLTARSPQVHRGLHLPVLHRGLLQIRRQEDAREGQGRWVRGRRHNYNHHHVDVERGSGKLKS
jgi:hypothetical protein